MFPMISDVAEFKAVREIVYKEKARLEGLGKEAPTDIKVGTMLEVPALIWQLDSLLPLVDFVSIGSNDLMQFFFACDRENPKLVDRYDPLSPSALSMLKFIVDKCDAHHTPVTLCGELGSKAVAAMAVIGVGMRRLSVTPASVGPVKMMIRSLNLNELQQFVNQSLSRTDKSLRGSFVAFAHDHGVKI